MFLTKHSTGFFHIIYENKQGKRCSKTTKTKQKRVALRFLKQFQLKIEEELYQDFIPITLKNYFFEYLKHSEPYFTWKTIKVNQSTFKMFVNYFGDVQLSTITKKMIEDYLLKRATEVSIFSARKDLINLSASLNKAAKDGYLKESPTKGIRRYRLPDIQPKFYSKEDFEKLISAMNDNPDMRDLVTFAVNTGFRQMELITLTWSQVNFEDKLITLDNRDHITKTKRIRAVPLNPDAYEVLMNRHSKRRDEFQNIFTLFNRPFDPNQISQRFKKYVYAAKIDPKLNFHSLRHTFASWLVQSGVSIYVVSKLLGHSSVTTTEIYSHLRRDDFQSAVNLLSQKRIMPVVSER